MGFYKTILIETVVALDSTGAIVKEKGIEIDNIDRIYYLIRTNIN
jgi:uncharacterized membrane protein